MIKYYTGTNSSISELATTGYVQEGYVPVLTIDAWKAQDHIQTTAIRRVCKAELVIEVESEELSIIGISAIRKLLSDMETNEIETLEVRSCRDRDNILVGGTVSLCADTFEHVPKTESDYLKEYRSYVFNVQRTNRKLWDDYVRVCDERDQELTRLKELAAKYPDQVKSIAGSM